MTQTYRSSKWEYYCEQTYKGKPSGNAMFARECHETPLTADAILNLVWTNIDYFGDHYYEPLTTPIEMAVKDYEESKVNVPDADGESLGL